ncbi:chaperone NapD [Bacillus sp. Bva_UNVM-123]|uniref:chaperone NapD n=1 Tax=Bacillus sp. Bva_UNVM-123 TaxID=2829798 RepID=UPI00391F0A1B
MVISGIYIETIPGEADNVSKALEKIQGVEVHHLEDGFKVILTVESDTVDGSYKIAEKFKQIDGVLTICLAYSNFEGEPFYQEGTIS